jgi:hypothetical protein
MPSERYSIIVSGEKFIFTRDQLESEPDNYFYTYFLGDFVEAANNARELNLQTDASLFKLIQAHLRGYEIFPTQDACVPGYMTKMGLRKEVDYFGLCRMVELIDEEMKAYVSPTDGNVKSGGSGRTAF